MNINIFIFRLNFTFLRGKPIEGIQFKTIPIQYVTKDTNASGTYLVAAGFGIFRTVDFMNLMPVAGNLTFKGYRQGSNVEARFGVVKGLITNPFDSAEIFVADYSYNCIRLIDRNLLKTSELIGKCDSKGHADGDLQTAQIGYPAELVKGMNQDIWFFDSFRPSLRRIYKETNSNQWQLVTVHQLESRVESFTLHPSTNDIYLIRSKDVSRIRNSKEEVVFGESGMHNDGMLSEASIHYPKHSLFLDNDVFLLSDTGNNVIRIVNLKSSTISSICVPRSPNNDIYRDGTPAECLLKSPGHLIHLPENNEVVATSSKLEYLWKTHHFCIK